jgi:hypothetical protein
MKAPIPIAIGAVITVALSVLVVRAYRRPADILTPTELGRIASTIGAIACRNWEDGGYVFGSATWLMLDTKRVGSTGSAVAAHWLVTNEHVAQNLEYYPDAATALRKYYLEHGICEVAFQGHDQKTYFTLRPRNAFRNENFDVAILFLARENAKQEDRATWFVNNVRPLSAGDQPLEACQSSEMGKRVYVFGYPASAEGHALPTEPELTGDNAMQQAVYGAYLDDVSTFNRARNLTVTEGIISGMRGRNILTTASMDAGVSGGLAVAKERGKVCIVGLPTWVAVGEFATLGEIQPFDVVYRAGFMFEEE